MARSKQSLYLSITFILALIFTPKSFYPFEWKTSWFPEDNDHELIEEIEDYSSVINWSTGKVITEVTMSITYDDPNIGRQFSEFSAMIREDLQQKLLEALGYLRISDLFLLKDYYSRQSDLRYEIVANVDNAFFYPPIINQDEYYGVVELGLFGEDGLASLFYRDLEQPNQDVYIQTDITEDINYFDGLIIDTISVPEFNPSIKMRILDEDGNVLYGPETIDEDYLQTFGVCEYTTKLKHAFSSERVGENIFYVMPVEISGALYTDIVLDNEDAARLFSNPDTIEMLNQSRVVVVKPQEEE